MNRELQIKTSLLGAAVAEALIQSGKKTGYENILTYGENTGRIGALNQIMLFTAEGYLRACNRASIKGIWGAEPISLFYAYVRFLKTQGIEIDTSKVSSGNRVFDDGYLLTRKELFHRSDPEESFVRAISKAKIASVEDPVNDEKSSRILTRMIPIGIIMQDNPAKAFKRGMENSVLSHGDKISSYCAGFLTSIYAFMLNGNNLWDAIFETRLILMENYQPSVEIITSLKNMYDILTKYKDRSIPNESLAVFDLSKPEDVLALVFLISLKFETSFEESLAFAIENSRDAHEIPVVVATILGMINGPEAIPEHLWNLKEYFLIDEIGNDLAIGTKNGTYHHNPFWSRKYPPT